MPTQMGRIAVPLTSFKTTMGVLFIGSIISPRIFISTSITMLLPPATSVYTFSGQRVGSGSRDPHFDVAAQQVVTGSRTQEVQSLVLGGAADPLAGRAVESLHQALL